MHTILIQITLPSLRNCQFNETSQIKCNLKKILSPIIAQSMHSLSKLHFHCMCNVFKEVLNVMPFSLNTFHFLAQVFFLI